MSLHSHLSVSIAGSRLKPLVPLTRARQDQRLRVEMRRDPARQAREYLLPLLAAGEVPSVIVGLDSQFERTLSCGLLRSYVQHTFHMDIGFDAGRELFSSMIALQLLATSTHPAIKQTLAQLADTVKRRTWNGRFYFFHDENGFSADTDCTGVAASGLYEAGHLTREELLLSASQVLASAAPESLTAEQNLDTESGKSNGALHEGVVMVYWEDGQEPNVKPRGRKHDPAAAANALYLLKLAQREGLEDPNDVIGKTLRYVLEHLSSGAYLKGTRYYPSPDTFLYFASRLCATFVDCETALEQPLRQALRTRNASALKDLEKAGPASALNIAMRILAADTIGHNADYLRYRLQLLQQRDGAFPPSPFYSLGRLPLFFGSSPLTTLFALCALS